MLVTTLIGCYSGLCLRPLPAYDITQLSSSLLFDGHVREWTEQLKPKPVTKPRP
jgi:hypothetical protein